MAKRLDELDYYALLGLSPDANVDDIKRAFHTFAAKYHPDRHTNDAVAHEKALRVYRRGTEAYRVLQNTEARRLYDRGLVQGNLRFDPGDARATQRPSMSPVQADVRSPKARPFLVKAESALLQGDFAQAKLNFKIALQHDPDNAAVKAKLEAIEHERPRR